MSFFHFWHLNIENGTKINQVIYCLIYCSIDTQYWLDEIWGIFTTTLKLHITAHKCPIFSKINRQS